MSKEARQASPGAKRHADDGDNLLDECARPFAAWPTINKRRVLSDSNPALHFSLENAFGLQCINAIDDSSCPAGVKS